MNKLTTVTVGIPAYNEEANIGFLISEILSQKFKSYKLEKIIVASDGSSDKTVQILKEINSRKLMIIDGRSRKGQSFRQDQIMKRTYSDILILLNADIGLHGDLFIENLIKPIIKRGVDLVSSNMLPLPPRNFFEKILYAGYIFRNEVFEELNNGENVYTCHGAARAFSRRLYNNFSFSNVIAEDAHSYLWSVNHSYKYAYAKNATAFIRLPDNLADHQRQSTRFAKTKTNSSKSYELPIGLLGKALVINFIKNPFFLSFYIFITFLMRLKSIKAETSNTWQIATSSKVLR